MATTSTRPLAVVTGGSSGIGLELAKLAIADGHDVLIAADSPTTEASAASLGANVESLVADLATEAGVDALEAAIAGRPVAILCANAGHGLGGAFLDQDFAEIRHVINTNVVGTIDLIQRVGRTMRAAGDGKILITGSIAGLMPGAFHAVYNGSKAFIDSFSFALGNELKDSGVEVTVLMPGATETEFFDRAGMQDTKVGAGEKQPADEVARAGWKAMKSGTAHVVAGTKNKLSAAISHLTPDTVLAEQHRKTAEPGSAAA